MIARSNQMSTEREPRKVAQVTLHIYTHCQWPTTNEGYESSAKTALMVQEGILMMNACIILNECHHNTYDEFLYNPARQSR